MRTLGLLLLPALVLAACSKNETNSNNNPQNPGGPTEQACTVRGESYVALSGTANCTGGLGGPEVTYAAKTPLTRKDNNFAFTFTLPKDGSKVVLLTNAQANLQDAVALTFTRTGPNAVKAHLKAGATDLDFTPELPAIDTSKPIVIAIDIHDHGDAIIELNGKELGYEFALRPTGKLWGFIVNNDAVVTDASVAQAKHAH